MYLNDSSEMIKIRVEWAYFDNELNRSIVENITYCG